VLQSIETVKCSWVELPGGVTLFYIKLEEKSVTQRQINERLILLYILDSELLPSLPLTWLWKLGLGDNEKSIFLRRLQFGIPSEVGVIKRPFVIDEFGVTGRSGQGATIETMA